MTQHSSIPPEDLLASMKVVSTTAVIGPPAGFAQTPGFQDQVKAACCQICEAKGESPYATFGIPNGRIGGPPPVRRENWTKYKDQVEVVLIMQAYRDASVAIKHT